MTLSKVDSTVTVPESKPTTEQGVPDDLNSLGNESVEPSNERVGFFASLRSRISSVFAPRQLNEGPSGLIAGFRRAITRTISYMDGALFSPLSKPSQVAGASGPSPLADTA